MTARMDEYGLKRTRTRTRIRTRNARRRRGRAGPAFAAQPGPGQEPVRDYPRSPQIVTDPHLVAVRLDALVSAAIRAARCAPKTTRPALPGRPDCCASGERVPAPAGGVCGGWISAKGVGPFRGEPGHPGA